MIKTVYIKTSYLIYLSYFLLSVQINANAQDVHFSQFYEAPLLRNPALAGIFTGNIRVQAIHRDQWGTLGVPFKTSLISTEFKMPIGGTNDFLTLGTNAFRDLAGEQLLKTTNALQSVTYHKSVGREINRYISAGFSAGITDKRLDPSRLTFDNQYSNNGFVSTNQSGELFNSVRRNALEITTGLSYNSGIGDRGNFFIGASAWHILKEKMSFLSDNTLENRKWQINAGIKTYISNNLLLHIETNIFRQKTNNELMLGSMVSYTENADPNINGGIPQISIGVGAFIRVKDAIIPVVKASYKSISVSFSMDFNTSQLKTLTQGGASNEVTISYVGFTRNSSESSSQVKCPRF